MQECDVLQACLDWVCCCPAMRIRDLPVLLSAVRLEELPRRINLSCPTDVHRQVLPQLLALLPTFPTASAVIGPHGGLSLASTAEVVLPSLMEELPPHVRHWQQMELAASDASVVPVAPVPSSSSAPLPHLISQAPIPGGDSSGSGGRGARRHKASHLMAVGKCGGQCSM